MKKESNLETMIETSLIENNSDDTNCFVQVEKDLISYGYFSVSSNHKKNKKELLRNQTKKIVVIRKTGNQQVTATIRSYDELGQPGNSDLRLFIGLMKLVQDRTGHKFFTNPIKFKAYELLNLIGYRDRKDQDGKIKRGKGKATYQALYKWLDRLATTTIKLDGTLTAEEKKYYGIKGGWRFADTYTIRGEENPDGIISDSIELKLTERALLNLNHYRTIPINYNAFFSLRHDIAQILVPLLQIWFYPQRGFYTKNYSDFCSLLGITEYKQESLIKQTLFPSLEELIEAKFLRSFLLKKNKSNTGFNLSLEAGTNFFEALQYGKNIESHALKGDELILQLSNPNPLQSEDKKEEYPNDFGTEEIEIFQKLRSLGIFRDNAIILIKSHQNLEFKRKIEYAQSQIDAMGHKVRNKTNYLFSILNSDEKVPETFVTKAEKLINETLQNELLEVQKAEIERTNILEIAYFNYLNELYSAKYNELTDEEKENRRNKYLSNADSKERQRINNMIKDNQLKELNRIAQFYFQMDDENEQTFDDFLKLDSEDNLIFKYTENN